jgi:hypothetical protein
MKNAQFLQAIATRHLVATVLAIISITTAGLAVVVYLGVASVSDMAQFVDAVFKAVALFVGALWTLNRYFVSRTDAMQLRVDADVGAVRDETSGRALLIYRLDVVNTGNALLPTSMQWLQVDAVTPSNNGVRHDELYRWPSEGSHPAGPIEPGSWSAINNAISVPKDVKAVRFYLDIEISPENRWTWHKTFSVAAGTNA